MINQRSQIAQDVQGQYAGFVTRFAAYALDVFIISLVIIFLSQLISLSAAFLFVEEGDPQYVVVRAVRQILQATLPINYFLFFWTVGGQTPGKSLMGIRIIRLDGRGISLWVALRRMVGYGFSFIFFAGFLWILLDERRQGFHDKLAGTVVVYAGDYQIHRHLMSEMQRRLNRQG